MTINNKLTKSLLLPAAGLILVACGANSNASVEETNTIRLGTSPGPYSELFLDEIAPQLEENGYTIDVTTFQDVVAQNTALTENQVDLNVEQHTAYLENYNKEAGADLVGLTPIPSLSSALYPSRKTSLEEVEEGDIVAIPEDPVNYARGLSILEEIGWVELEEGIEPLSASENDIISNDAGVEIEAINSPGIPAAGPDVDYMILPGAIAYDAGVAFDSALAVEELSEDLFLQVVVRAEDQDQEWVQEVVDIYESDEFKQRVEEISNSSDNLNWQIPE